MAIGSDAFERWRLSPRGRHTLPRLLLGTLLIAVCWVAVTFLVLTAGSAVFAFGLFSAGALQPEPGAAEFEDAVSLLFLSPAGVLMTLLSFAGIWAGVALAMRLVHREPVAALLGERGRVSGPDLAKGFAAALFVGLLSEAVLYLRHPVLERGAIDLALWLLLLAPAAILILVQTSAEEVLFRGYLLRGLAGRFRSPLVWALLPALIFTLLHWRAGAPGALNLALLATIGGFAALTVVLVCLTGNLGAAIGVHFGNNALAFLVVAHENELGALALFRGASLDALTGTPAETLWFILVGALVGNGLTLLLLVHPRSPVTLQDGRSGA